jgi:replication-associated recombination protein RarA
MALSFLDKYRPTTVGQFVIPEGQNFDLLSEFLDEPWRSNWFLHGKPGLGKSTMALLMAVAATKKDSLVYKIGGRNLDDAMVELLVEKTQNRPIEGGLHAIVVDEADHIPKSGREALLYALSLNGYTCWIFTTNDKPDSFGKIFGRINDVAFSAHGIGEPAVKWLLEIAAKEGVSVSKEEAEKIVSECARDIRKCLITLEALCRVAKRKARSPVLLDRAA